LVREFIVEEFFVHLVANRWSVIFHCEVRSLFYCLDFCRRIEEADVTGAGVCHQSNSPSVTRPARPLPRARVAQLTLLSGGAVLPDSV